MDNNNFPVILSTAYLAPLEYYVYLLKSSEVYIDLYENYIKQTYRNRCFIYGANGKLCISIPVIKINGNHTLIKDIKISYRSDWQKGHWKSIESSYNSSPYFLYYKDDLYSFFLKRYVFLIDFNQELLEAILNLIGIEKKINFTNEYHKAFSNKLDLRNIISHKNKNNTLTHPNYPQVFKDKHGFIPNLSIIDLLFNEGPNTYKYLTQIIPISNI